MQTNWQWGEKAPDAGHCHLHSCHHLLPPLSPLFRWPTVTAACGLRNRLAWEIIHSFFGSFILIGLPIWPMWVLHKQFCWQWWQRSMKWWGQSLCRCGGFSAGSFPSLPKINSYNTSTVGHSCRHTHAYTFGSPSGTSGKENIILHSGLGEQFCAGRMEMSMQVLLPRLLYSCLCMVCFELSACHPRTTIYSEEQSKHHHHFPRRLVAILCMSDKQSVHIISLLVFSLLQPESMHLRGGPKALSAYNLVSNTVFLFKLCKKKASSHLSSAESTVGSETN